MCLVTMVTMEMPRHLPWNKVILQMSYIHQLHSTPKEN